MKLKAIISSFALAAASIFSTSCTVNVEDPTIDPVSGSATTTTTTSNPYTGTTQQTKKTYSY